MLSKITNFLCALLIMLPVSSGATPQKEFNNIYTFGDSFSYEGTWTEFLTVRYGIKYVNGQNGFAFGGGKISDLPAQLSNYEANVSGFDSHDLYAVYMGPSDSAESHDGVTNISLGYGFEVYNYSNTGLSLDDFIAQYNKGALTFSQFFPITYA